MLHNVCQKFQNSCSTNVIKLDNEDYALVSKIKV